MSALYDDEFKPHFAKTNALYDSVSDTRSLYEHSSDEDAADTDPSTDPNTDMLVNTSMMQNASRFKVMPARAGTAGKAAKAAKLKASTPTASGTKGSKPKASGTKASKAGNPKLLEPKLLKLGKASETKASEAGNPSAARVRSFHGAKLPTPPTQKGFFKALKGKEVKTVQDLGNGQQKVHISHKFSYRFWLDGKQHRVTPTVIRKFKLYIWEKYLEDIPQDTPLQLEVKKVALKIFTKIFKAQSRQFLKENWKEVMDTELKPREATEIVKNPKAQRSKEEQEKYDAYIAKRNEVRSDPEFEDEVKKVREMLHQTYKPNNTQQQHAHTHTGAGSRHSRSHGHQAGSVSNAPHSVPVVGRGGMRGGMQSSGPTPHEIEPGCPRWVRNQTARAATQQRSTAQASRGRGRGGSKVAGRAQGAAEGRAGAASVVPPPPPYPPPPTIPKEEAAEGRAAAGGSGFVPPGIYPVPPD